MSSNASASGIRTAIGTQLTAVTQLTGNSLGRSLGDGGVPRARYYLAGIKEQQEDMDTATNYRVYIYQIDIIMALTIQGSTQAATEAEFEDAVDAVMDRFATNYTLGGVVESCTMEPSSVRYEETPQGVAAYLPLMLYCKTLIPI